MPRKSAESGSPRTADIAVCQKKQAMLSLSEIIASAYT